MRDLVIAEDEGFKPPIPKEGIPDFESSAFDHSANLPQLSYCKSNTYFENGKEKSDKKLLIS